MGQSMSFQNTRAAIDAMNMAGICDAKTQEETDEAGRKAIEMLEANTIETPKESIRDDSDIDAAREYFTAICHAANPHSGLSMQELYNAARVVSIPVKSFEEFSQ